MKASLRLTLSGFMLIAVTYGLARFAWGMMMPQVAQQISFSPRASGMLAACSYLAYCLATPGATLLLARWGVRSTAMLAALTAMLGLLLMAAAGNAWLIAWWAIYRWSRCRTGFTGARQCREPAN
ncbi:hypothetical protein E05_17300 [Plautia stali symbiont]|nr:hypothetical protein E05_17300 [Plautia stali symbiont]